MNREFAGNVRELENIIERAVVSAGFSNSILPEHFSTETGNNSPPKPSHQNFLNLPFKEAVAALERALIENALRESEGNRSEAARKLGINRRLLYDKIEEHKITNES